MSIMKLEKVVLVVDDEEIVLKMMTMLFKRRFKVCHVATNGLEAMAVLKQNSDIDCVITDISMPQMDGFELKKNIDQLYPQLPVIAVTGHSDDDNISKMEDYRFSHIVIKPVDRQKVDNMLEKIVSLSAG